MRLMKRFMRAFFHLLYHPFAFAYDLVASAVSFGKWNDWTKEVIPFIKGFRILEIGHGTGHLQHSLLDLNLAPAAIDESAQMGILAKRKLGTKHKLTRGLAQQLPFTSDCFDSVIATFPTEYIFKAQTLSEIGRCLSDEGRLIVMPAAWPKSGFLKWLYKITGESPADGQTSIILRISQPFITAGFETRIETVELQSVKLMIIVAHKKRI